MQVTYSGTVITTPRFFHSRHSHFEHEQFDCTRDDGSTFRVVDNVTLAPRVPVAPGDAVTVRGELVHDRGQPPIVHFTHHDPWGTHPDGFIIVGAKTYA